MRDQEEKNEKMKDQGMSGRAKTAALLGVAAVALFGVLVYGSLQHQGSEVGPAPQQESLTESGDATPEESLTESPAEDPSVISEEVSDVTEPVQQEEPEAVSDITADEPDEGAGRSADRQASETDKAPEVVSGRVITMQDEDRYIIPDKYNCGAKGNLTKVLASDLVNGIQIYESGGINVIDFLWKNTGIQGEVSFNNLDFSDYTIAVYNADQIDRDITLIFENCKFSVFRSLSPDPRVNLIFKNCTFNSFMGSSASFDRCKFGGSYGDGIVPFQNVTVRNCYISDMARSDEAGAGAHTDGTQIYGKEGINAENIRFEHCRFEVPLIPAANAINACIMLQMEFSNGINISFSDCICNGGGYTVYASSKDNGFQYYQNVSLTNIAVGQSHKWGALYPTVSDNVEISNIYDIDSLYVASVWKQSGKTHISVTNDTLQDRLLVVYADGDKYEFTIPATRGGKEDYFDRFEDYPIDIDIVLDVDCSYAVCFDNTLGDEKQIRCVTWDGSNSVSIPW